MSQRDSLRKVARRLGETKDRVVFVGGMVRDLLVTDPGAGPARPTKDVDLVIDVESVAELNEVSTQLRAWGFTECTDDGAPICRWVVDEVLVDIMPLDPAILGFSNVWYPSTLKNRWHADLGGGELIPIPDGPHFVATKLEAFLARGDGDYYHHDIEDVIALVNDREELAREVDATDAEVKRFIKETMSILLADTSFLEALPGHLEGDAASQARLPLLLQRLRALASERGARPQAEQRYTRAARAGGEQFTRPVRTASEATFPYSSNIVRARYDAATAVLRIEFQGGRSYEYFHVPRTIFEGLKGAASAGQYVHAWIRGRYDYRRVV